MVMGFFFISSGRALIITVLVLTLTSIPCQVAAAAAAAENSSMHKDFIESASLTYDRVIKCLKSRSTQVPFGFSWDNMTFPADALQHYQDLLAKTRMYRTNIEPHGYMGYKEKWIENRFIEKFSSLALDQFGGFIPIFVQWTDIHVHQFTKLTPNPMPNLPKTTFETLHKSILNMLRPTVLYVAVTQDDQGLFLLSKLAPNILSISGGGYGNVPIPLIKGNIPYHPINIPALGGAISRFIDDSGGISDKNDAESRVISVSGNSSMEELPIIPTTTTPVTTAWNHYVGFVGNIRPGLSRSKLLKDFSNALDHHKRQSNMRLTLYSGKDWIHKISSTMFNLAPRGFGRTSFRLAEIIQIGRIPVYIYDDEPWLPYAGTYISFEQFGYVLGPKNNQDIARALMLDGRNVTELRRKLLQVKSVRHHYTYEGVLSQLEMFFSDPFGTNGGQLRCNRLPFRNH